MLFRVKWKYIGYIFQSWSGCNDESSTESDLINNIPKNGFSKIEKYLHKSFDIKPLDISILHIVMGR